METAIRVRVPAKVNLVLSVGERLPDGYHRVATLLQAVSLFDTVTAAPARELGLSCRNEAVPTGPDNLAWRAATLLARHTGREPKVRLAIRKAIPPAAGLGGGSADAAAALLACDRLWGTNLCRPELATLAALLGADVPFFLWGGTARGDHRGERIAPLAPLPAWPGLLIVRPTRKDSTAAAYAALDARGVWPQPPLDPVLDALGTLNPAALGRALGNSFGGAEPALPGSLGTVLAGSGPGVFALAPSAAWARRTAREWRDRGWFARAVRLWPHGAEVLP